VLSFAMFADICCISIFFSFINWVILISAWEYFRQESLELEKLRVEALLWLSTTSVVNNAAASSCLLLNTRYTLHCDSVWKL